MSHLPARPPTRPPSELIARRASPSGNRFHFGCGVLVGGLLAVFSVGAWAPATDMGWTVRITLMALGCGLLAYWLGDEFWRNIHRW